MTSTVGKSRAAAAAYRMLMDAQVSELPVSPLALLRRCPDTTVYTFEEAAEAMGLSVPAFERQFGDADAFTFRQERDGRVRCITVYRADGNPARQRFTLAHELGHLALQHCGLDEAAEREADCFASHLLCPRPALELLEERFGRITAEQAAAVFYVSAACARRMYASEMVDVPLEVLAQVKANFAERIPVRLPPPIRRGK